MTRLHEILAITEDKAGLAKKVLDEASTTFTKRADHFMGKTRKVEYFNEVDQYNNESETNEMVTTVWDKLSYLEKALTDHVDILYQKDKTNQEACADLVVEGEVFATSAPATFLLSLENYLKKIRSVYEKIPTLKPGIKWEKMPSLGEGIWQAPDTTTFRSKKIPMHKIMVEATEYHPAQVHQWNEDANVAKILTTEISSNLTPLEKSHLLGRLDKLIQATKTARQRANNMEVNKDNRIGRVLFDYLHDH